jgi:hypothetical protein
MPKDRFSQLVKYFDSKKNDYTTYEIKQKVEAIISPQQVSADEMLAGINLLPDINDIKEVKKTVQLLYKAGFLDKKNLVLVTNETNFIYANVIHTILNHLVNTDLLNQANLDWILKSDPHLGAFSLKVDILAKNGVLTEKTLHALKAGKAKNLPDCIRLMQDDSHAASQLTPTTKKHISACGDIASELSINPFKLTPTWVTDSLSLEAKNDTAISKPIDNSMHFSPSVSALTILFLSVGYKLGLFKKGNLFYKPPISCIENAADSQRLEELDRLSETVNAAIEKYQDKSSEIKNKEPFVKRSSLSQLFSRNSFSANDTKKEVEQHAKLVNAKH